MKIIFYQDRNVTDYKIVELKNSINIFFNNEKNKKKFNIDYKFITFEQLKKNNFELIPCDYAIIFNVYSDNKKNTIYRKYIQEFQNKNNNKLIVFELGYINRNEYYQMGYNSIINYGNYPTFPKNTERLKDLVKIEKLKFNYNSNPEKHILLALQIPTDTQITISGINYKEWILNTINLIREYTKRKIIIRLHPKLKLTSKRKLINFYEKNLKNYADISNNSLDFDLNNSHCVIAFNSTILVDAIINSIPIIACHYSSIVYDLSEKIKDIENFKRFSNNDIVNCLSNISYKQWKLREIEKGIPFKYYIFNS
tara:strand:+ start:484 stop:1416 length:933 start_codon:yes stop_codon:yes gene_type:complete